MRAQFVRTLAWALSLYALVMLLVALAHDSLLYPAPTPRQAAFADGVTIEGRCGAVPASGQLLVASDGAPTVAHFHGNAEQVADIERLALNLRARGLGVLVAEFPGYGVLADADPSEQALIASARCTLSLAQQRFGLRPANTVLMGRSLGTGVAVALAAQGWGERLVLLAPYTSIRQLAEGVYPWLPTSLLVRDPFDSLQRARDVDVPTLVIHGTRDRVIPPQHSHRMAEALDARLLSVDAGHNDLFALQGHVLVPELTRFAWAF